MHSPSPTRFPHLPSLSLLSVLSLPLFFFSAPLPLKSKQLPRGAGVREPHEPVPVPHGPPSGAGPAARRGVHARLHGLPGGLDAPRRRGAPPRPLRRKRWRLRQRPTRRPRTAPGGGRGGGARARGRGGRAPHHCAAAAAASPRLLVLFLVVVLVLTFVIGFGFSAYSEWSAEVDTLILIGQAIGTRAHHQAPQSPAGPTRPRRAAARRSGRAQQVPPQRECFRVSG